MPMNFQRSLLTETVISVLRGVNDEISYEAGAARAQTAVHLFKSVLPSARRILAAEKIEFGVVIGQGLKRLAEVDKAHKTEANKKKIARSAGRAEKHAARIDLDKLPLAEQRMVTTNRTIFRMTRRNALAKPDEPAKNAVEPPSTNTDKLVQLSNQRKAK
jgi:hypothetical protein